MWPAIDARGSVSHLEQMTRTEAYAALRAALDSVGVDGASYSWHSLRAGAATSAANRGVPEPVMMAAGGWRSVTAARGYVHYSPAKCSLQSQWPQPRSRPRRQSRLRSYDARQSRHDERDHSPALSGSVP